MRATFDIRQKGGNQPAGTAFGGDDMEVPRAKLFQNGFRAISDVGLR
jgi:hypothetical protein